MSRSAFSKVGQAAADLALSLNSSLGSLIRRTQGLLSGSLDPEVARKLEKIEADALACRSELRNAVARGRRHSRRFSVLEPDLLLHRALEFAEPRAREAGVRISCALAAELPRVVGDPIALEHAFLLSLLGAVQAAKEDGVDVTLLVDVVWEFDLPILRISVSDDRPAPPFAALPDPDVSGHGFGLGVVRDVIADHGGRFEIRAGDGTGFVILLSIPGTTAGMTAPSGEQVATACPEMPRLPEEWERG